VVDQDALTRVLRSFASTLISRYDVHDILHELTAAATQILPFAGAGVSLADADGVLHPLAATDERTSEVERLQERFAEGPCVDAYRDGSPVVVADLSTAGRWPQFTQPALAVGVHTVAGFPMRIDHHAVGALNTYHTEPLTPTQSDLDAAEVLCDVAAGYVVYADALDRSRERATQLQHALESRVLIEQAKGVLAERHGVSPSDSFELLRRHARNHNLRLSEVARAVIDGSLRLPG
jgi:GAF domain-containing protein